MRRREDKLKLSGLIFTPCSGLAVYLLVTFAAFVFSQTLRTTFSATLLGFILAFGAVDVLLFALSLPAIRLSATADARTVERGGDALVRVKIQNRGIIPIPAITVAVSFPTADPTAAGQTYKKLALLPLCCRYVTVRASVSRRGTEKMGIKYAYVYDMLGAFRVRLKVSETGAKSITAMPKCLSFLGTVSNRDGASETSDRLLELSAIGDYGDVREYRPGDSMKQIHWKLSTKSDELQVRKYASETEKYATVFLDAYINQDFISDRLSYLEAVDRLFDEAYTAAVEASENGCEGEVTVCMGGVGIRFGSKLDNERLATALSGMGYDFPEEISLPTDNGGSSVFVIPFTEKGRGAVIIEKLKAVVTPRSSVCVMSLENLLPEADKKEYSFQLGHFLEGLSTLGVAVSVSSRGGDSRG